MHCRPATYSRSGPAANGTSPGSFAPAVQLCAASRRAPVRRLAAGAFVPLLSHEHVLPAQLELLASIPCTGPLRQCNQVWRDCHSNAGWTVTRSVRLWEAP